MIAFKKVNDELNDDTIDVVDDDFLLATCSDET